MTFGRSFHSCSAVTTFAVDLEGTLAEALDSVENLVGSLAPHEWLALLVVRLDVLQDGTPQLWNAGVGAAFECVLRQEAEETLHKIEPGRVGRGEVEVEARVASQPPRDCRCLVRREVVEDDVNLQLLFDLVVQHAEEIDEVRSAMLLLRSGPHFARSHLQNREQVERAVAEGVVGLAL